MKVYLAGPMTGIDQWNFPAFLHAAKRLRHLGHEVVSPAEHDLEIGFVAIDEDGRYDLTPAFDREEVLRWDCTQIASVAAVVLLSGWEGSDGVRRELAAARRHNVPVYEYEHFVTPVTRPWDRGAPLSDEAVDRIALRDEERGRPSLSGYWDDMPVPASEERVVNPATGGAKGRKLARFDLLPAGPLTAVAEHFGRGAAKYDDRNWERGYDWSLSFGALMRHAWAFWGGEDHDPETTSHHMAAVAFHALALLEFTETHPELDDRPRCGTPTGVPLQSPGFDSPDLGATAAVIPVTPEVLDMVRGDTAAYWPLDDGEAAIRRERDLCAAAER